MTNEWRKAGIGIVLLVLIAGGFGLHYWYTNRGGEPEVPAATGEVKGASDDGSSTPDGMPISDTVKLNQTVRIAGAWITPLEVVEESRCPQDVQCIQAGTVRVRAKVIARNDTEEAAQEVIFQLDTPMTVGMDQIMLTGVTPNPVEGSQISSESYVFTFTVTKGAGTEYFKG